MHELTTLLDRHVSSVATLPGTQRWVTSGTTEGTLTVGDLGGETFEVHHHVPDTDSIEFSPGFLLGVDAEHVLAANIHHAVLLRLEGSACTVVSKWRLRSKDVFSMHLDGGVDTTTKVKIVAARNYLVRLDRKGRSRYIHLEGPDVWGLAVSPDGRRCVNGRGDGRIELRHPGTLKLHTTYHPFQHPILAAEFVDDWTVVASDDAWQVGVLDLRTGVMEMLPAGGKIIGLHRLGDGRFVVVNLSRAVRVYNGETCELSLDFTQLGDRYIQDSAMLSDGSGILLACEQQGLRFARLQGGEPGTSTSSPQ